MNLTTINTEALRQKAGSLKDCLIHLKQSAGIRRTQTPNAETQSFQDPLAVCDDFLADEQKILASKVFRVMGHKTQVFTQPTNSLIRSRKDHVLEVAGVSIQTAALLGLNTNLVRAAAFGHDIGHVPFGHQGEAWIAKTFGNSFCHEVMGPIIAQKIERRGVGLNLTWETMDAMMRHSGNTAREGMSQEAWVLRHTDKFAYIFHDVNDIFIRMKYPMSKEIESLLALFGFNQRSRTKTAIAGLIVESAEMGRVSFEHSELAQAFKHLRELMYDVYQCVTQQNVAANMEPLLEFLTMINVGDPLLLLCLMTDKDAIGLIQNPMKDMAAFNRTAVAEIVPHLDTIGKVDLCDPCLDW